MPPRKPKWTMTSQQWRAWSKARRDQAKALQKIYERQAQLAADMVVNWGCPCDPIITVHGGPDGPIIKDPMVTHSLDCDEPK